MSLTDTTIIPPFPKTKALRALVYDSDGVLADTLPQHNAAVQATFRNCGFEAEAQKDYAADLSVHSSERIFKRFAETKLLPGKSKEETIRFLYDLKTKLYIGRIETDINEGTLTARPGIEDLLLDGGVENVAQTIGSASNAEAVGKLINRLGLSFLLTESKITCHSLQAKPSPRTYATALYGCRIPVKDYRFCFAVEDTTNGAKAALAAGMQVLITESSFTNRAEINALATTGLPPDELKKLRADLDNDQILILEQLEAGAPRKIAIVTPNLARLAKEHRKPTIRVLDDYAFAIKSQALS